MFCFLSILGFGVCVLCILEFDVYNYILRFGRLPEENNVTLGLSTSAISYDSSFRRRDNVSFELQITVSNETDNRVSKFIVTC